MNKKIKNQLLQEWDKTIERETIKNKNYKSGIRSREKFITILYRRLEPILDETINLLGIKLKPNLIEKINKSPDSQQKANHQKKLIKSLVAQFKKFPLKNEGFLPKDIQEIRGFNCAGGSLLFGRLLNKAKIKNYYGLTVGHVVNVAALANGSFVYICTRADLRTDNKLKHNIVTINNKSKKDENTGIKYLMLNHEDIPYRLILLLSQKDSILSIMDNLETRFFMRIRKLLFPEVYGLQRESKVWKSEKKYLSSPALKKILKNRFI